MSAVVVAALYKFVDLPDYAEMRAPLRAAMDAHAVKGTILLAREGVNGTIAGSREGVDSVLDVYKRQDLVGQNLDGEEFRQNRIHHRAVQRDHRRLRWLHLADRL